VVGEIETLLDQRVDVHEAVLARVFARSRASGADVANSMMERPERMSRRNC
jgi:hypothetical protein